jgi:hypothetical protein
MPISGSDIFSLVKRGASGILVPLLLAFAVSGCPGDATLLKLPPPLERLLADRGDPMLKNALLANSPLPFAVIVRFRTPVFPDQAEMLSDAGIPPVETVGKTALIVATAREISSLIESPAVEKIRYLGSQSSLARLHPTLEIGLIRIFEEGREKDPVDLLIRFRSPPDAREERLLTAARFAIVTRAGTTWSVRGTARDLPALLTIEEIIYFEAASKTRVM